MLQKLIILSVLSILVSAEKVRYDNFALYKVRPQNEEHLAFLQDLMKKNNELQFWTAPTRVGEHVSIVSPPEMRKELDHSLSKRSIYSQVQLENIQEALESQVYSRRKRDASRQLYWDAFQTYEQINDWFEYLAETYSDIVSVVVAGQSFEGRNITGIKISRRSSNRAFFLEGGQIGADWLSPTVLTYIVDQLVRGEDPEARRASEEFEWHIFPILNPDGHKYSDDVERLWLKNRRPTRGTAVGVDLTKNWNSQWGVHGGSFTPADGNFIGLGPFSEPETRSVSAYIQSKIGSNLSGLLSFRGFGQKLLIPFAHTNQTMYNYNEMILIGRRALGSLSVRYDTRYSAGLSGLIDDGATGALADWAKHRFNPPIAATYLLRDEGTWGYILPVNQVQPSCEETYDSVMAIIREDKFTNVLEER